MGNILPLFLDIAVVVDVAVVASNAPVYTRRVLVGGYRSTPPVIGAAASDAQAAGGVCWPVHTGQGRSVRRSRPRRAHAGRRPYHHQPAAVVSKCALRRGPTKRTERPGYPQTLPLRSPPTGRSPPFQPVSFCHK